MNVREMDFVLDMISAAIIELETSFEDASPLLPSTEAVHRAIIRMQNAKKTVVAAQEKEWDRILGGLTDDTGDKVSGYDAARTICSGRNSIGIQK